MEKRYCLDECLVMVTLKGHLFHDLLLKFLECKDGPCDRLDLDEREGEDGKRKLAPQPPPGNQKMDNLYLRKR